MTFSLKFEVDFDTPASQDPSVWTDLSSRLRRREGVGVDIGPGRGRASLALDNRDRALDPTNDSSSFNLVPMRHARLTADVDGTPFPLFRGFVEDWPPVWPGTNRAHVRVTLIDATAWLALQDRTIELEPQKAGERIGQLLDLAGWPAALRDLDEGVVRLGPVEQQSANMLRTVGDAVDAEDGRLWVAPDGKVTFRDRHSRLDVEPSLTVGPGGLPVTAVSPSYSAGPMVNVARVELASGVVYETVDQSSVDEFGQRDWPYRDLALPASEAMGLGDWQVFKYASPRVWLDSLAVHPGDSLADVLTVGPGGLVAFTYDPPGGGSAQSDVHVETVQHRISTSDWKTSFTCSPYFGAGPWMEWYSDEATEGEAWLSDEATVGGVWAP